jgi:chemotaxis signal transduction protein
MIKKELSFERMEKSPASIEEMAGDEDDFYEREELKEETLQFIVFRLAQEWYGVAITKVKEILKVGRSQPGRPGS